MHCFCLGYLNRTKEVTATMPLFKKLDPKVELNPCEDWLWYYKNSPILTIVTGALVGVINGIACAIFENVAPLEKCQTFAEQDRGLIQRIFAI
jgi:hypothetical protein